MPGAIAGTAILKTKGTTKHLHTITLTINNSCNLSCPHCYLNYTSTKKVVGEDTINSILAADFHHLAIVGKEPLENSESIILLEKLVERAKNSGKTISFITNGIGLKKFSANLIKEIDFIDVSFDGGPLSYAMCRNNNFLKVIDGIEYFYKNGAKEINALHTISDQNISHIDDMHLIKQYFNFNLIMFSPYIQTKNFGTNTVREFPIKLMLEYFKDSTLFNDTKNSILFLDLYRLKQEGLEPKEIYAKLEELSLTNSKVKLLDIDPLFHGILRITFDDLILTPYESLHPLNYRSTKTVLASGSNINQVYRQFLTQDCINDIS